MLVHLFPGQGSQQKGMGCGLFEEFSEYTDIASEILGYSIKELCLNDPQNQLHLTEYTQPALYVVNALSSFREAQTNGRPPDYLAGHSLGEYNALLVAGVFDFETGLRLVKERASLMARARSGGMAAVIGLEANRVQEVLTENGLGEIDLANFNSPDQIVISGPKEAIERAKGVFKFAKARLFMPLNVSAAFHSRYMEPASQRFADILKGVSFRMPQILVISNVEARPYDGENIKRLLASQISRPVRWVETIQYLLDRGAETYHEFGPGDVLTRLVQKIRRGFEPSSPPKNGYKRSTQRTDMASMPSDKTERPRRITAESLGSAAFRKDYNIDFAYVAGAMYKGIASKELVVRMGKAMMIGYLGTGGMKLERIEQDLRFIQRELQDGQAYGLNLLCNLAQPELEDRTIDLYLKHGVQNVEAAAYMQMTPSLVRFRLKNIDVDLSGVVKPKQRIIAKVSRPEVAEAFMSPAPEHIVRRLVSSGALTEKEASLGERIPMAEDICIEADSGGHTDQRMLTTLLPSILKLRDEIRTKRSLTKPIRVGAAGGIGTCEAAAAAFILGADFVLTGSINQCTVEAGTSDEVKDMLEGMNVQDTAYCPAGDMFEIGAKVQVLKKGLLFPVRANKLYDLYKNYNSLDEIDERTREQIQEKYFRRTFDQVWNETKAYCEKYKPDEIGKAERNPKHKMALIFRWYFAHTARLAMSGNQEQKVDYQIHCGPALGAFNQWIKGTKFERWRNRHVDEIGKYLMTETAKYLEHRFQDLLGPIGMTPDEE
jgi:trans-AT polyketide synthase, acyltransferase and oxidoreductase domains